MEPVSKAYIMHLHAVTEKSIESSVLLIQKVSALKITTLTDLTAFGSEVSQELITKF